MNFQGCFTVQLSRSTPRPPAPEGRMPAPPEMFSPVRQRILSYQKQNHLSTLFLIFFVFSELFFEIPLLVSQCRIPPDKQEVSIMSKLIPGNHKSNIAPVCRTRWRAADTEATKTLNELNFRTPYSDNFYISTKSQILFLFLALVV